MRWRWRSERRHEAARQALLGPGADALAIAGRALQGQNCRLAEPEIAEADVLIAPAVRVASLTDHEEREAAVRAGYAAAQAALPKIRKLLNEGARWPEG